MPLARSNCDVSVAHWHGEPKLEFTGNVFAIGFSADTIMPVIAVVFADACDLLVLPSLRHRDLHPRVTGCASDTGSKGVGPGHDVAFGGIHCPPLCCRIIGCSGFFETLQLNCLHRRRLCRLAALRIGGGNGRELKHEYRGGDCNNFPAHDLPMTLRRLCSAKGRSMPNGNMITTRRHEAEIMPAAVGVAGRSRSGNPRGPLQSRLPHHRAGIPRSCARH